MKIATSAYLPSWHANWNSLSEKLTAWVREAASKGADLLVFPEYAGCEAALIGTPQDCAPSEWAARMAGQVEPWVEVHSRLAEEYGVTIISGSLCAEAEGGYVNRSHVHTPDGGIAYQDKMILTPYERNEMRLSAGRLLSLFETTVGRFGILICYDSEFPLQARALCEAGAEMILVPSATDFPAGQTRVRQSCRARAIENQCLIVQSPVLGPVPACDVLDQGTGRAGVFCPPDHGLPSDGIIAQGATDTPGWVYAEVDPAQISAPRLTGQVGNFSHWSEQDERLAEVQSISPL